MEAETISAEVRLPLSVSSRNLAQKARKASLSDVDGVIGYHAPTVAPA